MKGSLSNIYLWMVYFVFPVFIDIFQHLYKQYLVQEIPSGWRSALNSAQIQFPKTGTTTCGKKRSYWKNSGI